MLLQGQGTRNNAWCWVPVYQPVCNIMLYVGVLQFAFVLALGPLNCNYICGLIC